MWLGPWTANGQIHVHDIRSITEQSTEKRKNYPVDGAETIGYPY